MVLPLFIFPLISAAFPFLVTADNIRRFFSRFLRSATTACDLFFVYMELKFYPSGIILLRQNTEDKGAV
jgi:hypothetical protein